MRKKKYSIEKDHVRVGIKYRIYPNCEQIAYLNNVFGSTRFVFNQLLASKKLMKRKNFKYSLSSQLNYLVSKNSWLKKSCPNSPLYQSVIDLKNALKRSKNSGTPKPGFRQKDGIQTCRYTVGNFNFENNRLTLAGCNSSIRVRVSRLGFKDPITATVTKSGSGKYYVSFRTIKPKMENKSTGVIGIDVGIKDFAILSTGEKIPNHHFSKVMVKRTKRLYASVRRKVKGSKNKRRALIKLNILHDKIANRRRDFINKLTTKLINENQVIALEGFSISRLMSNNRFIANYIRDAAWGLLKRLLIQKAIASKTNQIVILDQYYASSHICNKTGHKLNRKLKLSERSWECPFCNEVHDRDLNAALNIRNDAIRVLNEQVKDSRVKMDVVVAET